MPKESLDFTKGRYPFASEIFGTYRPMVGWASKRKRNRLINDWSDSLSRVVGKLMPLYVSGNVYSGTGREFHADQFGIGKLATTQRPHVAPADEGSFLLPELQRIILPMVDERGFPTSADDWRNLVNEETVVQAYGDLEHGAVLAFSKWAQTVWDEAPTLPGESAEGFTQRIDDLLAGMLDRESRLGAVLVDLAKAGASDALTSLLLAPAPSPKSVQDLLQSLQWRLCDPFVEFDPRDGLQGVSVSPLGIVHYFRQYFFEMDTFLGPVVGHVWLAPGSTVELVESSTRRTYTERATELLQESTQQREVLERSQDDLSDAIKQENRSDSKLGFSVTVNQAWPTGDASATTSINMDTTQQDARETTYKRMREQSEKASSELRASYKSTFKTVSEITDVSSKRYVISNESKTDLQNYELRRKMRRVVVQVQDIGTYLCWETFVDEPGQTLGLANLVHIAKQPDITPPPYPTDLPYPERKSGIPFDVKVLWAGEDRRVGAQGDAANRPEGIWLGTRKITVDLPSGYEFELKPNDVFQLQCLAARGEGQFSSYNYLAKYLGGVDVEIILAWGQGGLDWDEPVEIDLRGTVAIHPTQALLDQIDAANQEARKKVDAAAAAARAKADEAAFYEAAQQRIELAASVTPRMFEDLREEERTVVYRALIADLMAGDASEPNHWYQHASPKQRHVYSTVINAIFDVDRMLYFVAPEWWKPRERSGLVLGSSAYSLGPDKVVAWEGTESRQDNYLITGRSQPARLGSSLGWLLQLDGDDMRNRFLNAPWVRAVIPVRPGKEEAALSWLTKAEVEGTEGLDLAYAGQDDEVDEIIKGLAAAGIEAGDPLTIRDAIRYLCVRVRDKHHEGTVERLFPDRDGIDDGDKVWATPIDKVYEHGFYPLGRSFRSSPVESPTDGASRNFQVMSQWTEILPTDQVVPVPVAYDPVTGRQLAAEA